MRINRTALAVTATVALAGIGTGTALAATGGSKATTAAKAAKAATGTSSTALLTALAGKLGISLDTLKAAIVATAKDQVAADLKAGTITQAQADALNARIDAGGTTLGGGLGLFGLGGPGGGHGGPGGMGGLGGPHGVALSVAATYLGLTTDALDTSLDAGKTLAAIATAQGKTAAGLEAALVADAKTKIDALTGLTDTQKAARLTQVTAQIKDVVENGRPSGSQFGGRGPRLGA